MTQPVKMKQALERRLGYLQQLLIIAGQPDEKEDTLGVSSKTLRNFSLHPPRRTQFEHDVRFLKGRGLVTWELRPCYVTDRNWRLQGVRITYFHITKAGIKFLEKHRRK
jgi:hypothetical protein